MECAICFKPYNSTTRLPIQICKNHHTVCGLCLQQLKQQKCPFCRSLFDMVNICPHSEALQKLKIQESESDINFLSGQVKQEFQKLFLNLRQIVNQQISVLDIKINPHLKQDHEKIFNDYVQNWTWLFYDLRNWKWWWWCNKPWWNKARCQKCNIYWHEFQKQIDSIQAKRIKILQEMEQICKFQYLKENIEKIIQEETQNNSNSKKIEINLQVLPLPNTKDQS